MTFSSKKSNQERKYDKKKDLIAGLRTIDHASMIGMGPAGYGLIGLREFGLFKFLTRDEKTSEPVIAYTSPTVLTG